MPAPPAPAAPESSDPVADGLILSPGLPVAREIATRPDPEDAAVDGFAALGFETDDGADPTADTASHWAGAAAEPQPRFTGVLIDESGETPTTAVASSPAPAIAGLQIDRARIDYDELGKPRVLDWSAFVAAVIVPPLGVLAGIAASIVSARVRGWVLRLNVAAIVVGLVLTVAASVGAWFVAEDLAEQAAFDATVEASAAWCAALDADPALLEADALDWPAARGTINRTLDDIDTYIARWQVVADVAPDGMVDATQQVIDEATDLRTAIESARLVQDTSNRNVMRSVAEASAIPAYRARFCGVDDGS